MIQHYPGQIFLDKTGFSNSRDRTLILLGFAKNCCLAPKIKHTEIYVERGRWKQAKISCKKSCYFRSAAVSAIIALLIIKKNLAIVF